MKRYQIRLWRIIISLVIPLFIGFLGSQFTARTVNSWYPTLNKPPFSPPNWVFAPVWNLLFILMGIAFYLVWQKDFGGKIRSLLTIYFLQLFFNLLWSFFFFTLKNPLLAFCEIIILWFLILINIVAFFKVRKVAGYLLIPYLLWVSFASVLNFYLYLLN